MLIFSFTLYPLVFSSLCNDELSFLDNVELPVTSQQPALMSLSFADLGVAFLSKLSTVPTVMLECRNGAANAGLSRTYLSRYARVLTRCPIPFRVAPEVVPTDGVSVSGTNETRLSPFVGSSLLI